MPRLVTVARERRDLSSVAQRRMEAEVEKQEDGNEIRFVKFSSCNISTVPDGRQVAKRYQYRSVSDYVSVSAIFVIAAAKLITLVHQLIMPKTY